MPDSLFGGAETDTQTIMNSNQGWRFLFGTTYVRSDFGTQLEIGDFETLIGSTNADAINGSARFDVIHGGDRHDHFVKDQTNSSVDFVGGEGSNSVTVAPGGSGPGVVALDDH